MQINIIQINLFTNMNILVADSFKPNIDKLNKIYKISSDKFEDGFLEKIDAENYVYEVNSIFRLLFDDINLYRFTNFPKYTHDDLYFKAVKSAIFFLEFIHKLLKKELISGKIYERFNEEIIQQNLNGNIITFTKFKEIEEKQKLFHYFKEKGYSNFISEDTINLFSRYDKQIQKNKKILIDDFENNNYKLIINEMNSIACNPNRKVKNLDSFEYNIYQVFIQYFKAIEDNECLKKLIL